MGAYYPVKKYCISSTISRWRLFRKVQAHKSQFIPEEGDSIKSCLYLSLLINRIVKLFILKLTIINLHFSLVPSDDIKTKHLELMKDFLHTKGIVCRANTISHQDYLAPQSPGHHHHLLSPPSHHSCCYHRSKILMMLVEKLWNKRSILLSKFAWEDTSTVLLSSHIVCRECEKNLSVIG